MGILLKPGDEAPDFTLIADDGLPFTLSRDAWPQAPAVVLS